MPQMLPFCYLLNYLRFKTVDIKGLLGNIMVLQQ